VQLAAFVGAHLLAFALLAVTAWVAGRLVLRKWIEGEPALSVALGLSLLAHAAFALAAAGWLTQSALIVLIAAVHGLGLLQVWPAWRQALGAWRWKAVLGLTAGLAPLFVLALYPPTGFDETLYHLPIARAFAETGSLPFLPALRVPVFPPLNELLSAALLLLAGDVSTHLVQLLAALATAALLIDWGRRSFSPIAGWLAAAAFLGNPIVVYLSGTAYVEPLLILFITAAVYGLERWRDSRETVWLVLAALFAGSAAGVKYLGLFFVGAVFLAALPAAVRERRWRDLALAAVAVLAVLAPTYGRILAWTGNPLFPFYPQIFGSGLWDPQPAPSRPLTTRLVEYLRIPWAVLFDRRSVGWQPPYSPAYLLASPLLVYAFFRDARVRRLLAMALAYSLLFPILPPDSRYLAVVLPLFSLALGAVLALLAAPASWRLRWLRAVAVLLFLPGWLYALYGLHREGPLPATPGEREAYLRRELPLYAAVEFLDGLPGSGYVAYGIHAENMIYHADDGTLLGDWSGPAGYRRVLPALQDPEALHRRLRGLGVRYLLLPRDRIPSLPAEPAWRRRFHRIYADGNAEIYELSPFRYPPALNGEPGEIPAI
jgi:hypothetical protein